MNNFYYIIAFLLLMVLALNLTIRLYVLRLYRKLESQAVDFTPAHFFNGKRLAQEVLPRYPDARRDILRFVRLVRFSMTMATIILIIILYLGYSLIKFRS